MKNLTLKNAVIEVLNKTKAPLTFKEIYDLILSENLFEFKSVTPENVLKSTIRKNCAGIETKNSSQIKAFKIVGTKYWLNDSQY
jgi:restriction system protein